jgi:NitT/TauT family transport system substrate-binding protein
MKIRLYENYRFLIYAPFYAAHAIGAYAAEGIEVELSPSPGTGLAERALLDGAVEAIWAGPMRVMKHHDDHPDSPLVCFAEIVCRDPFSIVGRYPNPGFRLADLAELRFATVGEVPTPWLCLQEDLRRVGLDPERLDRVAGRSMPENLAALRGGDIAAAQFFEPVVEEALASGAGHLWHAASERGRTTYTAFVTTRKQLSRNAEALQRMVKAIHRVQQWLYSQSAADIASAIAGYFSALDRGVLTRALHRCQTQAIWGREPLLPEDGFERLGRSLVSGGFVRNLPDYGACVDNRMALAAVGGAD